MNRALILIFLISAALTFSQVNNDSNNRFMLGQSYVQAGEYARAKEIFAELYNSNQFNPQYFNALSDVLIKLKEYDAAINLVQQKIAVTPQDINLYGLLGSIYYQAGNEKKAFEEWDNALLKFPGNPVVYRVIANYAMERRTFDKAIEILKRGKAVAEDPNMFAYDLAHLYSITMGFREAAEEYCSILSAAPNQLNAIEGRLYSILNKPDALKILIEVFETCRKSDNISFDYLLARLYKEQKSFDKAYEAYKRIDAKQGNNGAELFSFAQTIFNEGEYKTSSVVFEEIIDKYPNSPFVSGAKLGFAKSTEAVIAAENQQQVPEWKPFYKVQPNSSQKVNEVITVYKDVIKMYPRSEVAAEALLRIGKLEFYNNGTKEAGDYYLRLINENPGSKFIPDALLQLAEIALLEGNLEEIRSYLDRVVSASRADQEMKNIARFKLANVYFYQGNFPLAKETLAGIMNDLKDNTANDAIELSLLLNTTMNDSSNLKIFADGELLAEQKKFDAAKEKYSIVAESQAMFMLNHLAKIRVAEMELAMDRYETSIDLFSKIAGENEKNIYADKALYLLGQIYRFGVNDPAKAVEMYESLLAKFPNSLYLDEARDAIIKLRNKLS